MNAEISKTVQINIGNQKYFISYNTIIDLLMIVNINFDKQIPQLLEAAIKLDRVSTDNNFIHLK